MYIKGLKELVEQIKSIEQMRGLKAILLAAGETLKGKLSIYPEQKSLTRAEVYGETFQSDKQRRYFFYALKNNLITVPYSRGTDSRSERFKASWAIEAQGFTRVSIGNDTTYGPYLMDNDRQSKFAAAIGWPTIDKVADDNLDEVSKFVVTEMAQLYGLNTG